MCSHMRTDNGMMPPMDVSMGGGQPDLGMVRCVCVRNGGGHMHVHYVSGWGGEGRVRGRCCLKSAHAMLYSN